MSWPLGWPMSFSGHSAENGDWEPESVKFSEAMKEATGSFIIEATIDGAMVPLNKKPKAEPESHKEARSVALRLKDAQGKLIEKLMISRLTEFASFLVSISSLIDEFRQTLYVSRIMVTGDGAKWIWQFGGNNGITRTVLDWHHLLGYYVTLLDSTKNSKTANRRKRLERVGEALWTGKVDDVL